MRAAGHSARPPGLRSAADCAATAPVDAAKMLLDIVLRAVARSVCQPCWSGGLSSSIDAPVRELGRADRSMAAPGPGAQPAAGDACGCRPRAHDTAAASAN